MTPDPQPPVAFDVVTVVVLRRSVDAPDMPDDELDALQARHLAYRRELVTRGVIAANGPFDEQSDPSYRGMSIFACDPAEAARLSDGDPSVIAGRLTYDVMEWWVARRRPRLPARRRPGRRPPPDARRLTQDVIRSGRHGDQNV